MDDVFNKIEYKEIQRLLILANEAVDPSINMTSWNFISHFELCSSDLYQNLINDESDLIKE